MKPIFGSNTGFKLTRFKRRRNRIEQNSRHRRGRQETPKLLLCFEVEKIIFQGCCCCCWRRSESSLLSSNRSDGGLSRQAAGEQSNDCQQCEVIHHLFSKAKQLRDARGEEGARPQLFGNPYFPMEKVRKRGGFGLVWLGLFDMLQRLRIE